MDNLFLWAGFIAALVVLIFVARKSLWLALILGAFILGFSNLHYVKVFVVFIETIGDPSIILLAVSVAIIPLIGGVMEETHLMESLIQNLRVEKKGTLMLAPALFGMLPMPGGALLSAPLVEKVGGKIKGELKAQINVWFRHLLMFIYPLAVLLPTTKMAKLNLYRQIIYMLPFCLFTGFLGYIFFIRRIPGIIKYKERFQLKGLLLPLGIILTAPLFHVFSMRFFSLSEIPLFIGVSLSLIFAFSVSKIEVKKVFFLVKHMKIWKFALIIFGMFLFLNVFKASKISSLIAEIDMSPAFLLVGVGAFLGFVTGRIQLPVSIILPIYFAKYSVEGIPPEAFAIMFFAVYIGYIITPVHPCVSVSLEFFNVSPREYVRGLMVPVTISLIAVAIVANVIL